VQSKEKGYVWFLESLDAIHRAIQGWSDLGEALHAALEVLVEVFACDRAWLLEAAFRHYDDRYHITAKILQDTHPATRAAGQGGGPLKDVTVGAASFVSQLNTVLAVTFLLVLHGRPYVELGLSLAGQRQQGYRQVIIGIKDAVAG
jgi:hypothetical protein